MQYSVLSNLRRTVVFAGMAVLAVLFACLLVGAPAQAAMNGVVNVTFEYLESKN